MPPHQQNGIISGYIINFLEDGLERSTSVAAHVFEYTIVATPYTEYVLSVAAINSVGQGPFSTTVEVLTEEDGRLLI